MNLFFSALQPWSETLLIHPTVSPSHNSITYNLEQWVLTNSVEVFLLLFPLLTVSDIKQHLLPWGILAAFLFCFLSVAPMKGILPEVFSHHRGMRLAPETHSCQLLTHSPNQKVLEEQVLWTGGECYLAVILVRFQGLGLQMDITHTRTDIYCPPTCSHMCADKQKHVHTLQRGSRPVHVPTNISTYE